MKHDFLSQFLWAVVVLSSFTASVEVGATNNSDFAFRKNAQMGRGINILNDDPRWRNPAKARLTDKHFALIKQAGFGNVRIAAHPFGFVTNRETFALDPKFFATLDWAVQEALKNKLIPIVDFHEHNLMGVDPLGKKVMFLAVWKQIAAHGKDYPPEVLFEICNEPNMKPEIWNELHEAARQLIRESNPHRTLIIGTVHANQIQYLKDLKLPDADQNIIVAIHYYAPIQFTHQGAPWSAKNKDLKDIHWNATEAEQLAVMAVFDVAQKWSQENGRPLTLGEFGAYEKADMKDRQCWTDFVARQAEKRNWSWSYWQFDSDFIAYDIERDQWVKPIQDALIPPKPDNAPRPERQ